MKLFLYSLFQDIPIIPGDGDTQVDAAPIDDYLIFGLVIGLIMAGVYFKKLKNKTM